MSLWSVCQVADRTHLLSGRISFWGGITSIYQTPQFVPRFAFPSHLQSPSLPRSNRAGWKLWPKCYSSQAPAT